MCAKNHLLIFSSFLDIWENVEWPRFFLDHPVVNPFLATPFCRQSTVLDRQGPYLGHHTDELHAYSET